MVAVLIKSQMEMFMMERSKTASNMGKVNSIFTMVTLIKENM